MADSNSKSRYRRILLKLSGEALMGDGKYGISSAVLTRIATEVQEIVAAGGRAANCRLSPVSTATTCPPSQGPPAIRAS